MQHGPRTTPTPGKAGHSPDVLGLLEAPDLVAILDSLPALVSYVDRDLVYRLNNRAYEEWFGHARGEVTGRALPAVLGDAAYAALKPYVERALAGERVTMDLQVPYKHGGTRDVRATYVPHVGPDGRVLGFVVHVADRTTEVEAQKAVVLAKADLERRIEDRTRELSQEKEYVTTILDAVSEMGSGVIQLEGPRITYANEAFLRLVGRTREEVLALASSLELSPPAQREAIRERFARRAAGQPIPATFEGQLLRADGTVVDVEVTSKELGGGRALSMLRDISARKAQEREQRKQSVARGIVRQLFAHLTAGGRTSYAVRRDIGRSLAGKSPEGTLDEQLSAYAAMGLGELRLIEAKGTRYTFRGSGLIDVGQRSPTPTCGLALGYLEGVLRAQLGREALGAETTCQAQGAKECTFHVSAR